MPGNSQRHGARRKPTTKKGPTVGSGGQRRKALEGRGPTPKAEDRVTHKAHKAAQRQARTGGGARSGSAPAKKATGSREMVVGRNAVVEALRAQIPVTTLYVAGRIDSDDRVREALTYAARTGIPVLETPRGELDRLTGGAMHQGLALQVPPYRYKEPRDLIDPVLPGVPLIVALDGVTDPRNLGAVLRCVGAFGGHGVVVPSRRSVGVTSGAWKASAGAAARVPVAQATNLTRALEDYRAAGFFVIGLDADGEVALPALQLTDVPLVIVVGSEGKGLSRLVRQTCDQIVSIPISSATESLNAGVAAGIALYEVARLRGTLG